MSRVWGWAAMSFLTSDSVGILAVAPNPWQASDPAAAANARESAIDWFWSRLWSRPARKQSPAPVESIWLGARKGG